MNILNLERTGESRSVRSDQPNNQHKLSETKSLKIRIGHYFEESLLFASGSLCSVQRTVLREMSLPYFFR